MNIDSLSALGHSTPDLYIPDLSTPGGSSPESDPPMLSVVREGDIDTIYLTQAGTAAEVTVPPGQNVVTIPVIAGSTIRLPFQDDNLIARLSETNGNLAIRSDDTTIILVGYSNALDEGSVTILDEAGDPVDVAATVAATDPAIDIPTAAGPGIGDLGTVPDNTGGVFTPFDPQAGLGGFEAVGGLQATALTYSVIEVAVVPLEPDEFGDLVADGTIPGGPGVPGTISPINYNDANATNENIYRDSNIMVVLDISGSMREDANATLPGVQTRIDVARAVLANLLHSYDTLGDVRVTVVTFNEGAEIHFTWGSVADAIASLDSLVAQDRTNYAAAVDAAQTAWEGAGKLPGDTENIIYFLSDGKPTLGGGSGHHLTNTQAGEWNDFLENPQNGVDHVYAVGIGDDLANPDSDLNDVARPDGDNVPPGDVLYVRDPAADLAERLINTIEGHSISGNVLTGVDTSGDGDTGLPGQADAGGDGTTHIYTFSYAGQDPGFAVGFTWDGTSATLTQTGAGGQNVSLNNIEVSFDTEHGRMTFDFANGDYFFTPGIVSADTDLSFHYGTRDSDGDVDLPGGIDADGPAGGADLVISIADVPASPSVDFVAAETASPDSSASALPLMAINEQEMALVSVT